MMIIGCDFHTRYQQIAMMDDATGELVERRLERAFQQKASEQDPEEDGGVRLQPQQQERLQEQMIPALPKKDDSRFP